MKAWDSATAYVFIATIASLVRKGLILVQSINCLIRPKLGTDRHGNVTGAWNVMPVTALNAASVNETAHSMSQCASGCGKYGSFSAMNLAYKGFYKQDALIH